MENNLIPTYHARGRIYGPCPKCGRNPGVWETKTKKSGVKLFRCAATDCEFTWERPAKPGTAKIYLTATGTIRQQGVDGPFVGKEITAVILDDPFGDSAPEITTFPQKPPTPQMPAPIPPPGEATIDEGEFKNLSEGDFTNPDPPPQTPPPTTPCPYTDTEIAYLSGLLNYHAAADILKSIFHQGNYLGSITLWNAGGKSWEQQVKDIMKIAADPEFIAGKAVGLNKLCPDAFHLEKTVMPYMLCYALFAYMNEDEYAKKILEK